jgi:hypothetical protein
MATTPAHKFKIGLVTATIWENDGFHSVDLQRAYKTREGDWKSSGSFSQGDLLNAAKCAERAEAWIARKTPDAA